MRELLATYALGFMVAQKSLSVQNKPNLYAHVVGHAMTS